jgi:hypothetical protein
MTDMSIIIPNPPEAPGGYIGSGDEIDIQRRITMAFIDSRPIMITLVPRVRAKQPTGGFAFQELAPRPPQKMRLIESSGGLPVFITGSDGIQRELEMILLGRWDCDLEKYDVFSYSGQSYEVAQLYFFNGWEQRAEVIKFG